MISDAEVDRAVELLLCPFCGGIAEQHSAEVLHWVACLVCNSNTSECFTSEEAIERWNTRFTLNLAGVVGGVALELEAIVATLPGVTYMDPPDGGSPSLEEQFKRMAVDARRYRYIRNMAGKRPQDFEPVWDAAFASTYGDTHNFDINIDDQISALAKGNDHGN